MLFDSHSHYFDGRFSEELDCTTDELLNSLFADEVGYIINVGTNPDNSLLALAMAEKYENMYVTVGLHPEDAREIENVDAALGEIEQIIMREREKGKKKIVAIGEIGFDYHYEGYDKAKQAYCFEYQLDMAERLSLPVVIHDREAHGDCFDAVCRHPSLKGVFHSFSSSPEMARELTKRGFYISFSGVITFKNAAKSKAVAAVVDKDKMLIETDCPYLAPHPFRGKLNHSGLMKYTALALAEARGESYEDVCRTTEQNAKRLFGIG